MNPPKYSYLFLVLLLCFGLGFAHKVLDDGNQFHEDEKEKQDHFGNMINPAKFRAGMGMQFHEDIEKEKQDRFGDMISPSKFGAGMGLQFHENIEKEKQDHFGNKINPTRAGAGTGMQFHKNNAIEKHDHFVNTINPTGAGAGMGMAYGWLNPPYQRPYPGSPIFGPEPRLPSPQIPVVGVGPEIGYDRPDTNCPCTVRCYHQYKMKLRQLRKAKRLRINELQNREISDDLAESGGIDESFGSLGRLYP